MRGHVAKLRWLLALGALLLLVVAYVYGGGEGTETLSWGSDGRAAESIETMTSPRLTLKVSLG
jgi:hypothetical protein